MIYTTTAAYFILQYTLPLRVLVNEAYKRSTKSTQVSRTSNHAFRLPRSWPCSSISGALVRLWFLTWLTASSELDRDFVVDLSSEIVKFRSEPMGGSSSCIFGDPIVTGPRGIGVLTLLGPSRRSCRAHRHTNASLPALWRVQGIESPNDWMTFARESIVPWGRVFPFGSTIAPRKPVANICLSKTAVSMHMQLRGSFILRSAKRSRSPLIPCPTSINSLGVVSESGVASPLKTLCTSSPRRAFGTT